MESHLSNEEFFNGLSELFHSRKGKDHGAIYLVQKRLTYGQDHASAQPPTDEAFPDAQSAQPLPIIIRATNGKSKERKSDKIKLSTIVQADSIGEFFTRYAEICKAGMPTLKPRDKSKKKAKAKKRKVGVPAAP